VPGGDDSPRSPCRVHDRRHEAACQGRPHDRGFSEGSRHADLIDESTRATRTFQMSQRGILTHQPDINFTDTHLVLFEQFCESDRRLPVTPKTAPTSPALNSNGIRFSVRLVRKPSRDSGRKVFRTTLLTLISHETDRSRVYLRSPSIVHTQVLLHPAQSLRCPAQYPLLLSPCPFSSIPSPRLVSALSPGRNNRCDSVPIEPGPWHLADVV
jgi:hypothetical protein